MFRLFFRFCLVLACCLPTACGGAAGTGLLRLDPGQEALAPSPLVADDPAGPIPRPDLPPDLAARAMPPAQDAAPPTTPPVLAYSLSVSAPDAPELEGAFRGASLLERLRETPVTSLTGLEQRLKPDLETAGEVLRAYGYYAGTVRSRIRPAGGEEAEPAPAAAPEKENATPPGGYVVSVTFDPGPRYTIGPTRVRMTEPFRVPPDTAKNQTLPLPQTLADAGLPQGAPAVADAVLDAVAAVRDAYRDRGYPYAAIAGTRYTLDHGARTLEAAVDVDSGPFVRMGPLVVPAAAPVSRRYLESLATWRPGRAWSQSRVESFRSALRQSGLFAAAEITPAPADNAEGLRPIDLALTSAPERTLGGSVKYDSDFGPGLHAYWEHRNLTGRGDRLRLEAPVWADLQEMAATYRLPFFLRRDQDATARAAFRHENTRAYELTSAAGSAGLERRISRRWRAGLSLAGEWGDLKDPGAPRHTYSMAGLPATVAYDGANSLLNATRGARAGLTLAPYTGAYNGDFSALRSRLEAQAFLPLMGEDTLVLALRGMYGLLSGAEAEAVPSSLRYYVGGGGSVRGYEYQSLGPRNADRDPLGGASAVEVSAEARVRFTETWGAVAFLDGGTAYTRQAPDSAEPLRWGAGVGLRMYTAIGPVRLDVATPLNPRRKDGSLQIYFSIGQSF